MVHLGDLSTPRPSGPAVYRIAITCDLEAHGDPLEVAVWETDWAERFGEKLPIWLGCWRLTSGSRSSRVVFDGGRLGGLKTTFDDEQAVERGETTMHVRYSFRCEECGDVVRARQANVQRALDGLRHAGRTAVTLRELRGIL